MIISYLTVVVIHGYWNDLDRTSEGRTIQKMAKSPSHDVLFPGIMTEILFADTNSLLLRSWEEQYQL